MLNYKKLQDKSGINVKKNSRKRDEKDERSTCKEFNLA